MKMSILIYTKIISNNLHYNMNTIGVPTNTNNHAIQNQRKTLDILLQLQKQLDDFKLKVHEMEEEMDTVKIENKLLKTKIDELTKPQPLQTRISIFGYR